MTIVFEPQTGNLIRILARLLRDPALVNAVLLVLAGGMIRWGTKWRFAARRKAAAQWPAIPATIEVVSVVESQDNEGNVLTYLATLTYFYRNPDLQMGEYVRPFPAKQAAAQWVNQFKDRETMVRVNPQNPQESVLLDAEVNGLTTRAAPGLEEALRMEKIPRLPERYTTISAIAEMVGVIGCVASLILFAASLEKGGVRPPQWMIWTGVAMLASMAIAFFVVLLRAEDEEAYRSFAKTYILWCPAWMRWVLNTSGTVSLIVWFVSRIDSGLVRYWLAATASVIPYLWFGWGFLLATAFHHAVVQSQRRVDPQGYLNERSS